MLKQNWEKKKKRNKKLINLMNQMAAHQVKFECKNLETFNQNLGFLRNPKNPKEIEDD